MNILKIKLNFLYNYKMLLTSTTSAVKEESNPGVWSPQKWIIEIMVTLMDVNVK